MDINIQCDGNIEIGFSALASITSIFSSSEFIWAVFGAILSTILGFFVPVWIVALQFRNRSDVLGQWKSEYQGIDEPQGTWVTEDIFIDTRFGKVRIKNANSSYKYDYTAYGEVVPGNHIVGRWTSIRPGANATGAFMLTISGQGDSMYGYWSGSDRVGARRYGRWVLARTDSEILTAKKHIEEMRKSRLAASESPPPALPKNT